MMMHWNSVNISQTSLKIEKMARLCSFIANSLAHIVLSCNIVSLGEGDLRRKHPDKTGLR